jgi:hypothetical protein
MSQGLSLKYAVRGGPRVFFSQQFSYSLSYCASSPIVATKHLFLCLLLLHQREVSEHRGCERISIIGIGDEACILPIYHLEVKHKIKG